MILQCEYIFTLVYEMYQCHVSNIHYTGVEQNTCFYYECLIMHTSKYKTSTQI